MEGTGKDCFRYGVTIGYDKDQSESNNSFL